MTTPGTCHRCEEILTEAHGIRPIHEHSQEISGDPSFNATNDYCEECFNQLFHRCTGCNGFDYDFNIRRAIDAAYCSACYNERYADCVDCNVTLNVEDDEVYNIDEYDDSPRCYSCHREAQNGQTVHEYSYKPRPIFHYNQGIETISRNTLTFGLELEVENRNRTNYEGYGGSQSMAQRVKEEYSDGENILYLKEDGSLNNGFEIVTHPFTWAYWKKTLANHFEELTAMLRSNSFRSYNTDSCGMHIHINKHAFANVHLYKFIQLIMIDGADNGFTRKISQRSTNSELDGWASLRIEKPRSIKKEQLDQAIWLRSRKERKEELEALRKQRKEEGTLNEFGEPTYREIDIAMEMDYLDRAHNDRLNRSRQEMSDTPAKMIKDKYSRRRHIAVNMQNDNTVEVRIFKGTLNFESFSKNLEFVHSAFTFCREVFPIIEATTKSYCLYVQENKKTYPNINNFIQQNELWRR